MRIKFKRVIRELIYKPGTNRIHWEKIISVSVIVISLLIYAIYKQEKLNLQKKDRIENARYTIGVTGGRYKNIKSVSPFVKYYYQVSNKEYYGRQSCPIEWKIVTNGGLYYVKFSSKDPSNAELLLDKPVPDNIKKAPYGGWNELPN